MLCKSFMEVIYGHLVLQLYNCLLFHVISINQPILGIQSPYQMMSKGRIITSETEGI